MPAASGLALVAIEVVDQRLPNEPPDITDG
jgi:hypothetical protein